MNCEVGCTDAVMQQGVGAEQPGIGVGGEQPQDSGGRRRGQGRGGSFANHEIVGRGRLGEWAARPGDGVREPGRGEAARARRDPAGRGRAGVSGGCSARQRATSSGGRWCSLCTAATSGEPS